MSAEIQGPRHSAYDAIVVGGGHNGLACDSYLARAGMDVLVLERVGAVGGTSITDETWLRPIPGYGDYRTPIEGMYICGAGTHPGGGVSGVPGRNCAGVVRGDRKWGRLKFWRR